MVRIRLNDGALTSGERMTLCVLGCALVCMLLSILVGALGALYYVPELTSGLLAIDLSLVQLRPLHTTFASAWIYLGAVGCVTFFLFATGDAPTDAERRRFRVQMICWGLAGAGALLTLPFGIGSGREYLGFHPVLSVLILVGWLLFARNFFGRVWRGFWDRPVYVYMWGAGILFFVYTFLEGHAYLLPGVREYPVADLQIQWKSCGTLVASFNQMVYGSLIFAGERLSGDKRLGQSKAAFALFGVGLLNSFTNFAHHTYHLPQSHVVKWIAFGVSMLEILILVGVFQEVTGLLRRKPRGPLEFSTSKHFIELSKCWNLCLLSLAILISVPPINALFHGTHLVMGHAMGSELAIDSYILFAVFGMILSTLFPKREVLEQYVDGPAVRRTAGWLNASLALLVVWLVLRGAVVGFTRYLGRPEPDWLDRFPHLFAVLGLALAYNLVRLVLHWAPLFLRPERHRLWETDGRAVMAEGPR